MNMKSIAAACSVSLASFAWAETTYVTFPCLSEPWDIVSDAAWGGSRPSAADQIPAFVTGGTYVMSADGCINSVYTNCSQGLYINNAAGEANRLTFDLKGHWLKLGGLLNLPASWKSMHYVTFTNGTVSFNNKDLAATGNWDDVRRYLDLTFDNCTLTNVANVHIGRNTDYPDVLRFTNGCRVHATRALSPASYGNHVNRLEILGGSQVSSVGFFVNRDDGSGQSKSTVQPQVLISGAGTKLTVTAGTGDFVNPSLVGAHGATVRVADGAEFDCGSTQASLGAKNCRNGRLIATGEGTKCSPGALRFSMSADSASASNNFICAYDRATVAVNAVYNGGILSHHNGFLCSNAVISCGNFAMGGNISNFIYRLQGDNPSITVGKIESYLRGGRNFIYDLPPTGYVTDCKPFVFSGQHHVIKTTDTADGFTLQLNGLPAYCRDMKEKRVRTRRCVLMAGLNFAEWGEYSGKAFYDAVARWNQEQQARTDLPPGATASVVRSGSTIFLDVKVKLGMAVFLR